MFNNIAIKLINFMSISLIAHYINTSLFGTYNALISIANSVNQFCSLGTDISMQRTGSKIGNLGAERVGSRFSVIIIIQLILNGFISFILWIWDDFFFNLLMTNQGDLSIFGSLGIVVCLQAISLVPLKLVMGLGEFRIYALRMLGASLIIVSFLILYVELFGPGLKILIYSLISALIINSLITWYVVKIILQKNQIILNLKNFKYELKDILNESLIYYTGNILIGAIANFIVVLYFNKYIGISEYGYLRISASLIAIVTIIPVALQPVTLTFLSGDVENNNYLKSIQLRYVMSFAIIVSFLLICFIDPIILYLFGNSYLNGKMIYVTMILIQIMIIYSSLISNFLVSSGHTNFVGISSTIGALCFLLLLITLTPVYKLNGYFIAYFIGYGVGFLILLYKEFSINAYEEISQILSVNIILILGASSYMLTLDSSMSFKLLISAIFIALSVIISYRMIMTNSEQKIIKFRIIRYLKKDNNYGR